MPRQLGLASFFSKAPRDAEPSTGANNRPPEDTVGCAATDASEACKTPSALLSDRARRAVASFIEPGRRMPAKVDVSPSSAKRGAVLADSERSGKQPRPSPPAEAVLGRRVSPRKAALAAKTGLREEPPQSSDDGAEEELVVGRRRPRTKRALVTVDDGSSASEPEVPPSRSANKRPTTAQPVRTPFGSGAAARALAQDASSGPPPAAKTPGAAAQTPLAAAKAPLVVAKTPLPAGAKAPTLASAQTGAGSKVTSSTHGEDALLAARTSRSSASGGGGGTPSWSPPPMALLPTAEETRQVSFSFLRDKRDAKGRKEGDAGYDPTTISVRLKAGEKLTPAMQQYWDIKKNHHDVVIFFKMGKFYELFEEDALLGHRELDLAFMGKEAPHVGFPEAALPKYADKLVALGYKVGVVEQMETPKELEERNKSAARGAKDKAVRRELCTILTKGTAAPPTANANYLLSVTENAEAGVLGICFIDVATGCISLGQCHEEEGKHRLRTLVAQLQPSEVLIDANNTTTQATALLKLSVPTCNMLARERYGCAAEARKLLGAANYFGRAGGNEEGWPTVLREAASLAPPAAFAAFGGCLKYLQRLLLDRQLLPHAQFSTWRASDEVVDEDAPTLVVDGKTLQNLEVFSNSLDGSDKGTLFAVLDRTATAFGKRELRKWICAPSARLDEICERQEAVAALLAAPDVREVLGVALAKLPDLERLLARVHSFSVEQASNAATHYSDVSKARLLEFLKALTGMAALDVVVKTLEPEVERLAEGSPRLGALLTRTGAGEGRFPPIGEVIEEFRAAFDWEQARKLGRVQPKPGQDAPYDKAVAMAKEVEDGLATELSRWRKRLGDTSITFWTPAGSTTEPFQLAVSTETLRKKGVPEGFDQMSSTKSCRRFWTDEIRALVEEHLAAKAAEEAALAAAARHLFAQFSEKYMLWRCAVECAAELDCLLSLAKVSSANGMCRPTFIEGQPFLHVKQGVNVCVQASLTDTQCIPNDIVMGHPTEPGKPRFLLVTGPNMGGKSTVLRQACITVLMAQLGCWVAAESCSLTPVDRIFTRVGANDAIMAGLSTFRVELEETSTILKKATPRSLVILDELGRGTATFDGMAIAYGALRHLVMETRCLSLFATHYHALAREFEHANPFVALFHMACAVDEDTRAVTFLYQFLPGACSRSHGIHVARLAGLAPPVLDQASQESAALEHEIEDMHVLGSVSQILAALADPSQAACRSLQVQLRGSTW